jgi:lactate dehydrogenase-like 2-hydroxyacid dehydrogenase
MVSTSSGHRWGPARRTDEDAFAYNWSKRENIGGIFERTVGILGFGEISTELARRLRGFAPARVLYHKRRRLPEAVEVELGVTYVSRDQLIAESDFLCHLLPYSRETDRLINSGVFVRMKPGACLVSCGSGSVISPPVPPPNSDVW